MASSTKAHCEQRRLPALTLKHCSLSIYSVYGIQNALYQRGAEWKAGAHSAFINLSLKIFTPNALRYNNVHRQNLKYAFRFSSALNKFRARKRPPPSQKKNQNIFTPK